MNGSSQPEQEQPTHSLTSIMDELIDSKRVFTSKRNLERWITEIRERIGIDFRQFQIGNEVLLTDSEKIFLCALLIEWDRPFLKRVIKGKVSKASAESDLAEAEDFYKNMMVHAKFFKDNAQKALFVDMVEQLASIQLKQAAANIMSKLQAMSGRFEAYPYVQKLNLLREANRSLEEFEARLQNASPLKGF